MDLSPWYVKGFWFVAVIAFFSCWIYAVNKYGLFLGLGLGWFPSAIIAIIAGTLWPILFVMLDIALVIGFLAMLFTML
jgi:hypothetical protein